MRGINYHLKGTPGSCQRVPEHCKVLTGLGRGLGEKYSLINKNWGCSQLEVGFEEEFSGQ